MSYLSYSRWLDSHWYAHWCVRLDELGPETRDNAEFEICTVASFTAAQIRADMEACVASACKADRHSERRTESDVNELRALMQEFLADVDEQYPVEATT